MRVRFTRRAITQLDAIFNYIARDNPAAAAAVVARIEERADRLQIFPIRADPPQRQVSASWSRRRIRI
jgi:plasmid stabilization system protein ParE